MAEINFIQTSVEQAPDALAKVGALGKNKPLEIVYAIAQGDGYDLIPGSACKLGAEQGSVVPLEAAEDDVFGVVLTSDFYEYNGGKAAPEDGAVAVLRKGYVVANAAVAGYSEGDAATVNADGSFDSGGTAVTGITVSRIAGTKVELRVDL